MNPSKDKAAKPNLQHETMDEWFDLFVWPWKPHGGPGRAGIKRGDSVYLFFFRHQIQLLDIYQIGRLPGYIVEQDDNFLLRLR